MRAEITDAVRLLESLKVGDAVTVTDNGRELTGLKVSRAARRSDGACGSVESTNVTVTYGPGRYAFEVRAEALASGRQTLVRVQEEADRAPVLESLKLEKGAAGQIASVGTVRYPGERAKGFSFGGNVYGGPVAYTFQSEAPGAGGWMSGFVADPDRFGTFHEDPLEWTRRYFAQG